MPVPNGPNACLAVLGDSAACEKMYYNKKLPPLQAGIPMAGLRLDFKMGASESLADDGIEANQKHRK